MSTFIPMDPTDYDLLPPDDLDACDHCNGAGVVDAGTDPATGLPNDISCPLCGGTGELTGPNYLNGGAA